MNYLYNITYMRQLENRKANGFGICLYTNGNIYKGEWKNKKRDDFGYFYFQEKNQYYAKWTNNFLFG